VINSWKITSIAGDYNALYEIMQRRVYDKLSSYNATMTGWDDILLKLTEKNQSETQIKDFFKGDDILLFVWKNDWGQGRQDMIYKYANLGYKTVMSNSSAFYFDMVDDKDLDNVGLSWSGYADYKDMWTVMSSIFLMIHMELKKIIFQKNTLNPLKS
jgi:hexosaminidase